MHIEKFIATKPNIIAKKPLPFTSKNVAMFAKEFYGEPYGWGGNYGCRDCSETTRDFLEPFGTFWYLLVSFGIFWYLLVSFGIFWYLLVSFGIFVRRNSSKQAKDGSNINIKGLKKLRRKRKIFMMQSLFASYFMCQGISYFI